MSTPLTLHRNERLKSRTLIGRLFREGNSYVAYPLRVVWLPMDAAACEATQIGAARAQLAISVPKRVFKTAVERNRLKRRIREAYRLHKKQLYDKLNAGHQCAALMLVYIGKEELPYSEIARGVQKMIQKFPA